jgi:hypothetical protein
VPYAIFLDQPFRDAEDAAHVFRGITSAKSG